MCYPRLLVSRKMFLARVREFVQEYPFFSPAAPPAGFGDRSTVGFSARPPLEAVPSETPPMACQSFGARLEELLQRERKNHEKVPRLNRPSEIERDQRAARMTSSYASEADRPSECLTKRARACGRRRLGIGQDCGGGEAQSQNCVHSAPSHPGSTVPHSSSLTISPGGQNAPVRGAHLTGANRRAGRCVVSR